MVTLTNWQAKEAAEVLAILSKRALPVKSALKVARIIREMRTTLADVEALRMAALERLALKDEKGKLQTENDRVLFPTPEAAQEFAAYFRELMIASAEYCDTLSIDDLGAEPLSPDVVLGLGPLFVEGTE